MFLVYLLAFIGLLAGLAFPVVYIWCIKPGKSIQEGLRDWINEGQE